MDLNQLLFQHQRALIGAQYDVSAVSQDSHLDLACHYAGKIRSLREQMGVHQYGLPPCTHQLGF